MYLLSSNHSQTESLAKIWQDQLTQDKNQVKTYAKNNNYQPNP